VRDSHPPETSATETQRVEERRRHEELSPDIVALIASCGEKVRRTDSVHRQPREDSRPPTTDARLPPASNDASH